MQLSRVSNDRSLAYLFMKLTISGGVSYVDFESLRDSLKVSMGDDELKEAIKSLIALGCCVNMQVSGGYVLSTLVELKERKNFIMGGMPENMLGKRKYLDHVYLADSEYSALVNEHGEEFTKKCIQVLDDYIPNQLRKKYKSHYRAIRSWVVNKVRSEEGRVTSYKTKSASAFDDEIKAVISG